MENLNLPVLVGEQIAGRASTVRKQLILLSDTISTNTFDVLELLVEAKENNYYAQWGFKSIGQFGENELGLKERKIQYLCRIGEVCAAVGVKRSDFEKVGIAKLREITVLDPEQSYFNGETGFNEPLAEHIVALIDKAPSNSVAQVKEEVLRLQGRTGGDRPVVRSFSCPQDAWENVIKKALERVRMRLGSAGRDEAGQAREYSDGACFEAICADFLAGTEEEEAVEQTNIPMETI